MKRCLKEEVCLRVKMLEDIITEVSSSMREISSSERVSHWKKFMLKNSQICSTNPQICHRTFDHYYIMLSLCLVTFLESAKSGASAWVMGHHV